MSHADHVAAGFCPFIDWAKTWCNGKAGHSGHHWARYLHRDGRVEIVNLDRAWHDGETPET